MNHNSSSVFKQSTYVLGLVLFMLTLFKSAQAKNNNENMDELLLKGQQCQSIQQPLKRLDCYDNLFILSLDNHVITSQNTLLPNNPVVFDTATEQTTKASLEIKSLSGRSIVKHSIINPPLYAEQLADNAGKKYLSSENKTVTAIPVTLIKATKNKYRRYSFYLDNGQIWQQLEARYLNIPKNMPVAASLTQGALASYNLQIDDKPRVIKVKRVK